MRPIEGCAQCGSKRFAAVGGVVMVVVVGGGGGVSLLPGSHGRIFLNSRPFRDDNGKQQTGCPPEGRAMKRKKVKKMKIKNGGNCFGLS